MRTTTRWRKALAGLGRQGLVVILGGLALIALPRDSEASAFVITLLNDSSGGGGASGSTASGLFNLDAGSGTDIPRVTVGTQSGVLRPSSPARPGTEADADRLSDAVGAVRKAIVQVQFENAAGVSASPAANKGITAVVGSPTSSVDSPAPGIANLNLGNGESLTVSERVAQSLVTSVSGDVPTTNAANEPIDRLSGIQSSSVGSHITNGGGVVAGGAASPVAADVVSSSTATTPPFSLPTGGFTARDPGTSTDIVSYPGENTALIPVGVAGRPATEADPVAAPEPGSLLLLASGLAMAGRILRRRPSRRRPAHATSSCE